MMTLATAREEHMNIIAKLRMKQSKREIVPKAASTELEDGESS